MAGKGYQMIDGTYFCHGVGVEHCSALKIVQLESLCSDLSSNGKPLQLVIRP